MNFQQHSLLKVAELASEIQNICLKSIQYGEASHTVSYEHPWTQIKTNKEILNDKFKEFIAATEYYWMQSGNSLELPDNEELEKGISKILHYLKQSSNLNCLSE